jgi:hypothetical protein
LVFEALARTCFDWLLLVIGRFFLALSGVGALFLFFFDIEKLLQELGVNASLFERVIGAIRRHIRLDQLHYQVESLSMRWLALFA